MHGRLESELPAFQAKLDEQALLTRPMRHELYALIEMATAARVLDVGCGSGAISQELGELADEVVCIDIDRDMALRSQELRNLVGQADGAALPFRDESFDIAICNLTLMWAPDPVEMIREMARVVRPGGLVVASMEPDYGGKVHYPENPLIDLVFRGAGIARRGGDPKAGRKLREQFVQAGLQPTIRVGNSDVLTPEQDIHLWQTNRSFYRRMLAEADFEEPQIDAWENEYLDSISDGSQLSWFPFFQAIARVSADRAPPTLPQI